jgi:large subunit ribosomal protein L20
VPRVKRGTKRRANRRKTLGLAKGFFLTKSKLHRAAQEAVEKSLKYGYVGRRLKKRDFRSLWIVRIGAACRAADISYSRFMSGLKKAGVDLNRKILADMALQDAPAFRALVNQAKASLEKAALEKV